MGTVKRQDMATFLYRMNLLLRSDSAEEGSGGDSHGADGAVTVSGETVRIDVARALEGADDSGGLRVEPPEPSVGKHLDIDAAGLPSGTTTVMDGRVIRSNSDDPPAAVDDRTGKDGITVSWIDEDGEEKTACVEIVVRRDGSTWTDETGVANAVGDAIEVSLDAAAVTPFNSWWKDGVECAAGTQGASGLLKVVVPSSMVVKTLVLSSEKGLVVYDGALNHTYDEGGCLEFVGTPGVEGTWRFSREGYAIYNVFAFSGSEDNPKLITFPMLFVVE